MKKLNSNINKNSEKYREYQIKKAALFKITGFLSLLCIGAIVSLMLPLRPRISATENRVLTSFPKFSLTAFMEGDYFKQIDTWFSDTFPFRDNLITYNEQLNNLYGVRTTSLHGEVVAGDEIPDVDINFDDVHKMETSENVTSLQQGSLVNYGTANGTTDSSTIDADEIGTSVDKVDNSVVAQTGERLDSIFVVGDSAYNYYAFSQSASDHYTELVNDLADRLAGTAGVYDMIVPTSIDIALDDATRNSLSSSNQKKAIKYMYSKMNQNVRKSYIYDVLKSHSDEYLYFRTDHHWTALGAYYAYSSFVEQIGMIPNALSSYECVEYPDFKGSFLAQSGVTSLGNNPDTIYAYKPLATNDMEFVNSDGDLVNYNIITDVSDWKSSSKYSTFIGGDNSFAQIHNDSIDNGKKCLVIKESYGNAFVPYLTDHFEDVYVVDYRYYTGTASELVDQYGIDTVLLLNNISATSTVQRINDMQRVCK